MEYVISQVFACLTYLCMGLTFITSSRTKILIFNSIALFCNAMHYTLLGAWAGVGVVLIAVFRNLLFLIQQKIEILDKYILDDILILIALVIITIVTGFITYDTVFSLLTIASSMVYTISVWQKNIKVYRVLGIISSVLSLMYFIYIKSLLAIISEIIIIVFMLIATIKYFKKEINKKESFRENIEGV